MIKDYAGFITFFIDTARFNFNELTGDNSVAFILVVRVKST